MSSILNNFSRLNSAEGQAQGLSPAAVKGWHPHQSGEGCIPQVYPSSRSLHDPLHIYFNILMNQLIVSGSQASLIHFAHSSSKYISGLYKLYLKYEWPQVLEYNFRFHK